MRLTGLAFILAAWTAVAAPQFEWLRVGEVKPRGWLLERLQNDVRHGFASSLDRLTDRCDMDTFDTRKKAELKQPKIGGVWWDGETTGKWLDGFVRMAYLADDAPAKARADALIAQVLATQDDDGYLGCYPRAVRYQSPIGQPNNGELWDQACLFPALLAYYELTGREDVRKAVERAALLTLSKYGPEREHSAGRTGA
jgi:DUF1680 family protein